MITMKKVVKQIEILEKEIEILENKSLSRIRKSFKRDYRALKKELDLLYALYEKDGVFDYNSFIIDNRDLQLNILAAERMIKSYTLVVSTTQKLLDDLATKTYHDIVTSTDIKAIRKTYDVDKIVNSNISGLHWLDTHNKNRDKSIKLIADEVKKGLESGRTYSQVSKDLADRLGTELYKAERVVKTESNRVVNDAKLESFREINTHTPIKKKWVSSRDEKVRSTHQELDGTIIGIEEEFEVNGNRALAPGLFGVPQEDISCRCIMTLQYE